MTLSSGHRAAATDTYQAILDTIAPNASRLKESYNGHLGRALGVAVGVHLLGLGVYWLIASTAAVPAPPPDRPLTPDDIVVVRPPTLTPPTAPPSGPPRQALGVGIATPVPDEVADPTATVAPNEAVVSSVGPVGPETGSGGESGPPSPPRPFVPTVRTNPPLVPQPPVVEPEPAEPEPAVFTYVEEPPVLIGGIERLQSGIEYPSFDRSARNQGRVTVQFVVDEAGVPSQITVVRSVSPGLDAAAVAAVRAARFTPGRQNGRAVKVRFTLPVTFQLR